MQDPYIEELERLRRDPRIRRMADFEQHKGNNTLGHVCHVAHMSHKLTRRLHLRVNDHSLLVGALLHDYYLYDFRDHPMGAYRHGTTHAQLALENALRDFPDLALGAREQNIIYSHMWPLNLTHLPRCKEAWVVTVADKVCAASEMLRGACRGLSAR